MLIRTTVNRALRDVLLCWIASIVMCASSLQHVALAQGLLPSGGITAAKSGEVNGKWSYRSFVSNPDLTVPPNNLLFGSATLELQAVGNQLTGTIGGSGWQLNLSGSIASGDPVQLRFTGKGVVGGEEWIYDYMGYVVPNWPSGVDQRPAIVGTIVRSKTHSAGAAPAGFVAQWIAVSQANPEPGTSPSVTARHQRDGVTPLLESPNQLPPAQPARGQPLPSELRLKQQYLNEFPPAALSDEQAALLSLPTNLATDLPSSSSRSLGAARKAQSYPAQLSSSGGRLDVTLDVAYATVGIGKDDVNLRTYNQCLVGPTLRLKAGDTLYITLNNRLPVEPTTGHAVNGHHDWNTTNLHFHGLHVAPQGPAPDEESDNVLLALPPSAPFDPAVSSKKYKVKIPSNHVAGTFWYHAHKHGSTSAQVSSGMAGALIVERDDAVHNLDKVDEVGACQQEVMLLQQIPYLKPVPTQPGSIERSPATPDPNANDVAMFSPGSFRSLGRYITVSGQKIPEIKLQPGELRRLRFIHSGQRESVRLRIERAPGTTSGPDFLTMYEIAVDGLPTGGLRTIHPTQAQLRDRMLELYPGYRSDCLLQAPDVAGTFYLVDTQNDTGGVSRPDKGADGSDELLRWVAKITVEGPAKPMPLPSTTALAAHRLPNITSPVTNTQYAFYGLNLSASPIQYLTTRRDFSASSTPLTLANAEPFNPGNPRLLDLGTTARWLVGSRNNGAPVIHPFHIHVNPFLITKVTSLVEPGSVGTPVDVTGREIGSPLWRDTLAMKHGYTYELLTKYEDFTGDFVDHCHILDHEDNGMMERVRIQNPLPPSPSGVTSPVSSSPASASNTRVVSAAGNKSDVQFPPRDGTAVMFFVKGSFCPHCMTQLVEMSQALRDRSIDVSVVSASTEEDLKAFPKVPFRMIADPELRLFRKHGIMKGEPQHGTLVARDGREVFRQVGPEPLQDVNVVLDALARPSLSVVVDVRSTFETTDDYITWAPTECTARVVGGDPSGSSVIVHLTNDNPTLSPEAGNLKFASSITPGQSATLDTISLNLPQSGQGVKFYIAGSKVSQLTAASLAQGGRDAVMEIHRDSVTGQLVGSQAVMVRARRNISKLNTLERAEYLDAIATMKGTGMHERFATMHAIGTGRVPGSNWPDQSHRGPGFLPWHRAFLLHYERVMQTTHPHVSLHFWREDEPSNIFVQSFLGANRIGIGLDDVDFGPLGDGNPLHGWTIGGVALNRERADRANIAWCNLQANVISPSAYRGPPGGNFSSGVESNPHNDGHGWVGGWMADCQTSPQDPVFFSFHADIDRLWAVWQWDHDRFQSDGSDPLHYRPSDNFVSGSTTAFGHHLFDTMWPWDEIKGPGAGFTGNRPNSAPEAPFPASLLPGTWPAALAKPQPATMIDYLGVGGGGVDLGFCYEDVPFGIKSSTSPSASPQLTAAVWQDANQPVGQRVAALRAAADDRAAQPQLVEMATKSSEPIELRAAALRTLQNTSREAWITVVMNQLANKADSPMRGEALRQLQSDLFSSSDLHESNRLHDSLRQLVNSQESPQIRSSAISTLMAHHDSETLDRVKEGLKTGNETLLSKDQAIRALAVATPGQHLDLIRPYIEASEPEPTRVAALGSLGADRFSSAARQKLALDRQESATIREAALRSLMINDESFTSIAMGMIKDESEVLSMRLGAAQGLGIYATHQQSQLNNAVLTKLITSLSSIRVGDIKLQQTIQQSMDKLTRILDRR